MYYTHYLKEIHPTFCRHSITLQCGKSGIHSLYKFILNNNLITWFELLCDIVLYSNLLPELHNTLGSSTR